MGTFYFFIRMRTWEELFFEWLNSLKNELLFTDELTWLSEVYNTQLTTGYNTLKHHIMNYLSIINRPIMEKLEIDLALFLQNGVTQFKDAIFQLEVYLKQLTPGYSILYIFALFILWSTIIRLIKVVFNCFLYTLALVINILTCGQLIGNKHKN